MTTGTTAYVTAAIRTQGKPIVSGGTRTTEQTPTSMEDAGIAGDASALPMPLIKRGVPKHNERQHEMDLTESIAPRSDQINADDLISGPITVTITDVREGAAEQPVDVILAEYPGRAYRPSKSMRRILVMAWGAKSAAYVGHQLTLFRNPEITFGRDKVGGIEIEAMSHIDKPLTVALTATRGKRKSFTVKPLVIASPTQPARDFRAEADTLTGNVDGLRALYMDAQAAGADPDTLAHIKDQAKEPQP